MAKPPTATRLIQSLLSSHEHLSTQQIYSVATDSLRPVIQPAHVLTKDGRIRMKKVSNMREGRRPWVPMPSAPFPEHPFKSVSFLKKTVLASLESQGLIHKARIDRPIETDEERHQAIADAMRLTRKDERTAMRLQEPVPPPRVPKTTVREYAWKMGSMPARDATRALDEEENIDMELREEQQAQDLAQRMRERWASSRGETLPSMADPAYVAARWDQADRLEQQFNRAREFEEEQIEQRRSARRTAYKLDRQQKQAERAEDDIMGRSEAVKAERRRIEALEAIEHYARQTGEDVSDWYAELGQAEGESIPVTEDAARRRKKGFGLR